MSLEILPNDQDHLTTDYSKHLTVCDNMTTWVVNKNEADTILQGAVIMGCGGGGPLSFARKLIKDMDSPAIIQSGSLVSEGDWMAMIALVGSPSKVKEKDTPSPRRIGSLRRDVLRSDSTTINAAMTAARSRWQQAIRTILKQAKSNESLDQIDGEIRSSNSALFLEESPNKFLELVRRAYRLNFFSIWVDDDTDDVDGSTTSICSPVIPVKNTFKYLQSQCRMRATDLHNYPRFKNFSQIKYLLTGELGAVNMASILYLSSVFEVLILDCDGAGRAVPFVNMITYANNLSVSPSAVVSPKEADDLSSIASVTMDFPKGKESLVEEVLADLLVDADGPFTPYVGYGTYVTRGHEIKDIPVWDTYNKAMAVGEALENTTGQERMVRVIEAFAKCRIKCKKLFQGHVTANVLQDNSARDLGHVTLTSRDGKTMKLWYMNEFFLAIHSDRQTPVSMAPDLIMLVPSTGPPVDLSSLSQIMGNHIKTEVFILAAEASPKIKTPEIIESFEKVYGLFVEKDGKAVYKGSYRPTHF